MFIINSKKLRYNDKVNWSWFIPAIILICLFFYFPPLSLSIRYPALTAIGVAIICVIPMIFALSGIRSFSDFLGVFFTDKVKMSWFRKTLIPLILYLILTILFIYHFDNLIDKKIDKEGVYTQATILDRKIKSYLLRYGIHKKSIIVVAYRDNLQKTHQLDLEVPNSDFNKFAIGQTIELKYLPDNPEVVRLIYGDKIQKFKHIPQRKLNYNDFTELFAREGDKAKTLKYLRSISYPWQVKTEDGNCVFSNEEKQEQLSFINKNLQLAQFNSRDKLLPKDLILREAYLKLEGVAVCLIETKDFVLVDRVEIDSSLSAFSPKYILGLTTTPFHHIFLIMPDRAYDEILAQGTPL